MRIGIIGTGNIGKTLARKLSAGGHTVTVANSRGPETIDAEALEFGARAATSSDAVKGADVVILSIPFARIPTLANLLASEVPGEAVVIDTSNYYPHRDGKIDAIERGQVESLWVAEQLGRPIVKAWNAVLAGTFQEKGVPAGTPGRIAIPVAADSDEAKRVGMKLVDETGFDPFDAGSLADSWRISRGSPPTAPNSRSRRWAGVGGGGPHRGPEEEGPDRWGDREPHSRPPEPRYAVSGDDIP